MVGLLPGWWFAVRSLDGVLRAVGVFAVRSQSADGQQMIVLRIEAIAGSLPGWWFAVRSLERGPRPGGAFAVRSQFGAGRWIRAFAIRSHCGLIVRLVVSGLQP